MGMTIDKTKKGNLIVTCECGCQGQITIDENEELKIVTRYSTPKTPDSNNEPTKKDSNEKPEKTGLKRLFK